MQKRKLPLTVADVIGIEASRGVYRITRFVPLCQSIAEYEVVNADDGSGQMIVIRTFGGIVTVYFDRHVRR